jgi:hypothetical protein
VEKTVKLVQCTSLLSCSAGWQAARKERNFGEDKGSYNRSGQLRLIVSAGYPEVCGTA